MVVSKIVSDDAAAGRPAPSYIEFRLLVDRSLAAAVHSASSAPIGKVLIDLQKYCGASVTVAPPQGRPAGASPQDELILVRQ